MEIETYDTLSCIFQKFIVNDKETTIDNFGYSETYGDIDDYECNNIFIVSPNVLEKYEISKGEYHQICEKIKEKLRVTNCG